MHNMNTMPCFTLLLLYTACLLAVLYISALGGSQ